MATQHNFRIKNGLEVAGTERISSAGVITGALSGSLASATTATTQSSSDNSTKIATTAYTDAAITALVDSSPGTLNTLNELAAALGDDASFSTTVTNSIATKLPLSGGTITGDLTTAADVNIIIQGTHNEGGGLLDLKGTDTPAAGKNLGALSFGNSNDRSLAMIRGISSAADAADLGFFTEAAGASIERRMTILSTGNVGIGTNNPLGKFVVSNGGAEGFEVFPGSASGQNSFQHYNRSGSAYLRNRNIASEFTFNLSGASSDAVTFKAGGNVGIGTASPDAKLDVNGNIAISNATSPPNVPSNHDQLYLGDRSQIYNRTGLGLSISTNNEFGGSPTHKYQANGTAGLIEMFGNSFKYYNAASGTAGQAPSWTNRFTIDSLGKVGIGTSSPAALLHVFGTENGEGASIGQVRVQSSTAFGSSPKAGIVFTNQHTSGSQAIMGGIYVGKDTTADSNYAGHMAFSTRAHGAVSVERMRINSSGTVSFGPDAQDIQIFPASINSGINKIYFRGNASNDKAEISLNHYGHHNYHIGAGLVGNALFNIGTAPTTPSFVMDTSGNVGIGHVPAGYATSGYKLRLDGGSQTYLSWNNDTHTTQVVGGFHIGTDSAAARIIQRENQPIIFSTNDTNRMEITGSGVVSAPIASTHGGSVTSGGIANPPASYLGSNGSDYGTTAIFRTPTIESTASSTTTSQFLTIYSSGHWAEYPCFRFKVYGTYYVAGYREYLGFLTSTSASLVEVQTNGTTSFFGGGGNNTITMGAAVGSGLASHGGQARYRRDFSLTTHGNYGRCYVVVEIMFGGNRYFGSNTTTANLDADGATGGSYHFKTMSAAQGQGVFSST